MPDNLYVGMFSDDTKALRFLRTVLWPTGARCPHCGETEISESSDEGPPTHGPLTCKACGQSVSVRQGSVLEDSAVPLHKWLQAIFLTDGGIRPIRPIHIGRIVGVSGATAAEMLSSMESDQICRRLSSALRALDL